MMRHGSKKHFKRGIARRRQGCQGFTLIEILIVVAILGIILAIAGPTWMRQRELSQQRSCQESLTKIEGAKEQWALELNKDDGASPGWDDLAPAGGTGLLKRIPICPKSGTYTINPVGTFVQCSVKAPLDHNESL